LIASQGNTFGKIAESKVLQNLMIAYQFRIRNTIIRVYGLFLATIEEKEIMATVTIMNNDRRIFIVVRRFGLYLEQDNRGIFYDPC
jgi:hypothetical protein